MVSEMYYSERQGVRRPLHEQEIGETFWGGFVALIRRLAREGYFAEAFPLECDDNTTLVSSGDTQARNLMLRVEVPSVTLTPNDVPDTLQALDAVEFFARRASKPGERGYHPYYGHDHVSDFSAGQGFADYQREVNRLLARSGHPYELGANGSIQHVGAPVLRDVVLSTAWQTGDDELNRLLSAAVEKFRDADPAVRSEALEKLWDAWERLKTLLSDDKKQGITDLLDQAVPEPKLRVQIEAEARILTAIGNEFMIRHTETTATKIVEDEHVEYLFHRMFALIYMLLRAIGRASP